VKDIDDFEDSSTDKSIVEKSPYGTLSLVKAEQIRVDLIKERLTNLQTAPEIRRLKPKAHQELLNKPAILGKKKAGAANRSKSKFPAPLSDVKAILNAVPSNAKRQKLETDSIVPTFRGLGWKSNLCGAELFFSTRAHWKGERQYSSQVFKMAQIDIAEHTKEFVLSDRALVKKYSDYDLSSNLTKKQLKKQLTEHNAELEKAAKQLKKLFELAKPIQLAFIEWKTIFPGMRDAKILNTAVSNPDTKRLSLAQILSYIYVNSYADFKALLGNLESSLKKLDKKQTDVILLRKFLSEIIKEQGSLSEIPFLSEGQIPRHALLYAFGVKKYTKTSALDTKPLFLETLHPQKGKTYLGKLLVTENPHTLFSGKDKAISIPDFDEQMGGAVIGKTIIGEKEIQHQGGNLQGSIVHSVNIKLPKFHHKKMPSRYHAKYGLDPDLYKQFQTTFNFLLDKKEFGKLSWMYLETVLLAHLIQFHEIQLFKYCNTMAKNSDKKIKWHNRENQEIANPFPEMKK